MQWAWLACWRGARKVLVVRVGSESSGGWRVQDQGLESTEEPNEGTWWLRAVEGGGSDARSPAPLPAAFGVDGSGRELSGGQVRDVRVMVQLTRWRSSEWCQGADLGCLCKQGWERPVVNRDGKPACLEVLWFYFSFWQLIDWEFGHVNSEVSGRHLSLKPLYWTVVKIHHSFQGKWIFTQLWWVWYVSKVYV